MEVLKARLTYDYERIDLMIKILLSGSFGITIIYAICHITSIVGKCYLVRKVTESNLSDEQVESIAKMMSKDININIPIN
ncbi:hypothetical protein DW904_15620 [Ruminococcus sp. AM42-11]|nr:hypothetical protein DW904_15620 [Ruminococcus sp. AM42-11]